MLATNREFETVARTLDRTIAELEVAIGHSPDVLAARWHEFLVRRRRMVELFLLNRRLEARRPVVSFVRWVEGNGALYDVTGNGNPPLAVPGAP
jgi:hypothetical protein